MSKIDKYQSRSTANWIIPGDIPGRSQLYGVKPEEDEYPNRKEENTSTIRTIADEFYKNQLVKSLSKQSQNISQRVTEFSINSTRNVAQPLAIFLLIMAGMLLGLPEFNNQFSLKSNESFAANNFKTVSAAAYTRRELVSDKKRVKFQKETIHAKADNKNQQTILIKLTNKPVGESRIITHTVVKGDTLWDIAEFYVKDPFRYPELAKLSNIVTPDLIYPGNIVRIQT